MKCCTEPRVKAISQLKKAEGMLRKVIQMLEEDKYCIDILQQSLAVQGMIKGAEKLILDNHLHTCFIGGLNSTNKNKKEQMLSELIKLYDKK